MSITPLVHLSSADAYAELQDLVHQVNAVAEAPGDWQDKYHAIFSVRLKHRIDQLLSYLSFRFEWDDPDAGYDDDALAYVRALNRRMPEINLIIGGTGHV